MRLRDWVACLLVFLATLCVASGAWIIKRPATGGGVGTDPAGVANRVIHLIGDDTTGADGDAIATWPAATGTSNAGSSGTGPVKKTAIANGHTVARFNGTTSVIAFSDVLSGLSASTAYIVVKLVTDPPIFAKSALWSMGTAADGTVFPFEGDSKIYDAFGSTARKVTVDPASSLSGGFRVYAVSSAAGAWANYLDGTSLFTTATNTVGFIAQPRIGYNTVDGSYLEGDVAEVVIYSDAHDATTVGNISTFLKAKYAP